MGAQQPPAATPGPGTSAPPNWSATEKMNMPQWAAGAKPKQWINDPNRKVLLESVCAEAYLFTNKLN